MKKSVSVTTNPTNHPIYEGPLDFAFIGHTRDEFDITRTYPTLEGRPISEMTAQVYSSSVHVLSSIHVSLGGRELHGELISIPYMGTDFHRLRHDVQDALLDVLEYCIGRGTKLIGLGALIPSISRYGHALTEHCPLNVGLTTGHSYTAHAIAEYVRKIELLRRAHQVVAIVGAAGSTGKATIDCLLSDGVSRAMILIDLPHRISHLTQISSKGHLTCTSELASLLKADVVVCVTNAAYSIIQAEHLPPNCIVIDDAQPPNVPLDVVRSRPDVLVLKCLARVPDLKCAFNLGLFSPESHVTNQDNVFTCLAETVMLAANNHKGHFTIGKPTSDQVKHIAGLAKKFEVGIGALHSFPEVGEIEESRIRNGTGSISR
jgi:fatty aldehyde-generating acyl-ACP reductase